MTTLANLMREIGMESAIGQYTREQGIDRPRNMPRVMRPPEQRFNDPNLSPPERRRAYETARQQNQFAQIEARTPQHVAPEDPGHRSPLQVAGDEALEMTGLPSLSRGADALRNNDPGRALPELAMGGLGVFGMMDAPMMLLGNEARVARPMVREALDDLPRRPPSLASEASEASNPPNAGPILPSLGANDRSLFNRIRALRDEFTDSASGQGFSPEPKTVRDAIEQAGQPSPVRSAFLADRWAQSMHRYIASGNLSGFSSVVNIAARESPGALVATARAFAEQSPDAAIAARAGDFNSVNDLAAAEDFLTHVWQTHDPQFQANLRVRLNNEQRAARLAERERLTQHPPSTDTRPPPKDADKTSQKLSPAARRAFSYTDRPRSPPNIGKR